MKKKKIIIVIATFLIIGSIIGIIIYRYSNYAYVLKVNWGIHIPALKEIYAANLQASFHGDGLRYHIFAYSDEKDIENLFKWSDDATRESHNRALIDKWLSENNIPVANYPDYANTKYWYKKRDDNSEIIILWNSDQDRIYIIEYLL